MEGTQEVRASSSETAAADQPSARPPDAEQSLGDGSTPARLSESTSHAPTLEEALAALERTTETALDAAAQLTRTLRRLRAAAQGGNLRDLRASLAAADQAA